MTQHTGNGLDRHTLAKDGSTRSYVNCKILLPKFNTWEQGQIEREKGSLPLFDNAVDRFLAKNHCRYSAIALPLHRNRIAVTL